MDYRPAFQGGTTVRSYTHTIRFIPATHADLTYPPQSVNDSVSWNLPGVAHGWPGKDHVVVSSTVESPVGTITDEEPSAGSAG